MMASIRNWIKKHKRALIVSVGLAGVGYICYRSIQAHHVALREKETNAYRLCQAEQRVEAQLQLHFQSVQRISDTTTLPFVLPQLKSQVLNKLNLSLLTEKLKQGKEVLSGKEKIMLWHELKILSFTLAASSIWALVLLVIFVRVQLNILARHLYMDAARDISVEETMVPFSIMLNLLCNCLFYLHITKDVLQNYTGGVSRNIQQRYVAFSEFFPRKGLEDLISDTKKAVEHVLASKPLREPCSLLDLRDIFVNIGKVFEESKPRWLTYMLPDDNVLSEDILSVALSTDPGEITFCESEEKIFNDLLTETRDILESIEFNEALTTTYNVLLDHVVEDLKEIYDEKDTAMIPFARLIPPVSTVGASLLDQPGDNKFVQRLTSLSKLESFCGTIYSTGSHLS